MSALLLYLESREEERGNIMKEKVDEILEFIDKNRHKCDFGCDNGCERGGSLSDIDVDELESMLHNLLDDELTVE